MAAETTSATSAGWVTLAEGIVKTAETKDEAILQRVYLWWSLGTLYMHECQVRVTIGASAVFCYCTCVTYFER